MKPWVLWGEKWALAGSALALLGGCDQQPNKPEKYAEISAIASKTDVRLTRPERHILALGDSLFAGYGVRADESYPAQLEAALRARGLNLRVHNAGVSGDTSADGLARLAFTLKSQAQKPDLAIISLGGNDMLRGLPPTETRRNLDAILVELKRQKIQVVMMGMLAPPNMGAEYAGKFKTIYPDLAKKNGAKLVPFFLSPVIDKPELQQADHIHPTATGIGAMVQASMGVVAAGMVDNSLP